MRLAPYLLGDFKFTGVGASGVLPTSVALGTSITADKGINSGPRPISVTDVLAYVTSHSATGTANYLRWKLRYKTNMGIAAPNGWTDIRVYTADEDNPIINGAGSIGADIQVNLMDYIRKEGNKQPFRIPANALFQVIAYGKTADTGIGDLHIELYGLPR